MFDHPDDAADRVARHLRRPVQIDPALDGRVMREVETLAARRRVAPVRRVWDRLTRPRLFAVTPLGGLIAAAGLVALIVAAFRTGPRASLPDFETRAFQFVLVAPGAARVAVVGDFNDWDATRTPMQRTGGQGMWTAVLQLPPGRYRYAFLVDGAHWQADPTAPAAGDPDYGAPSSVLTVAGAGS